ncbi:transcriptional regulator SlyA [Aeromonas cavernicola]|uniref:Transcriptional regulator SlyA n=1 Tax=Aeromonas cavernicola TaxID=1006623 RepID=A0A2H9U374_9GAMM|nr:transcriptional regulator SlyA [Aeromonas cavernicola]PJG58419.1 transcriptional regulator SlyA [Aeromonas cavernicola]
MTQALDTLRDLSLAEQLGRLHRLWRTAADVALTPLGLTQARWTALWKLNRLGDHLSQKTLADALEIELPSLMRTLGQLEEQGLITRHCCQHDKRARIVCLTPAGKALLAQMEQRIITVRQQLLSGISEPELRQFEQLVQRISSNALAQLDPHRPS